MGSPSEGARLRHLHAIFRAGTVAGLTDAQLLERFSVDRGESADLAFEALVDRHGPMVLRTCRGILRDDHEAQDALQATFLLLARKASSLWGRDSLGPWLHRVAYRVAVRAKRVGDRRRLAERRAAGAERGPAEGSLPDDWAPILHAEIDLLPDRYRFPVVLCDLEGRTCDEAARRLGCPVGTLKSRLARGRERLRGRLVRRGLAPVVVTSVAAGPSENSTPEIPAAIAETLARNALRDALGPTGTVGTSFSAAVVALMEETSMMMQVARLERFSFDSGG